MKALIAALVGAVVALILLPLSQVASFAVNEYLSRPLLRIEFAEVVSEDAPIAIPTDAIREIAKAPIQQILLMRGFASGAQIGEFADQDSANSTGVRRLKSALNELVVDAQRRVRQLTQLQQVLRSPKGDDKQIRAAVQEHFPEMATMVAAMPDVRVLQASVSSRAASDLAALNDGLRLVQQVAATLEQPAVAAPGRMWFKVSIVNRGSSDGLVRNVGELKVAHDTAVVYLRRSGGPPTAAPAVALQSIAVSVVNPTPTEARTTDVGKVEKHSVTELWFEIDESVVPAAHRADLWRATRQSASTASLILFDHENAEISTTVALTSTPHLPGRPK